MIDYTTNPRRGEAYLSEDDPVRGRTPELYLTLFDPTSEEDQPALAVPASVPYRAAMVDASFVVALATIVATSLSASRVVNRAIS